MFVISKHENGDYRFEYTTRKGDAIFTSINCKHKSDCEMIIDTVKKHIEIFSFTKKCSVSGQYFFRLSKGGLVLASSRTYTTELRLSKTIERILEYAPKAEVLDFSDNEFSFPEEETVFVEAEIKF